MLLPCREGGGGRRPHGGGESRRRRRSAGEGDAPVLPFSPHFALPRKEGHGPASGRDEARVLQPPPPPPPPRPPPAGSRHQLQIQAGARGREEQAGWKWRRCSGAARRAEQQRFRRRAAGGAGEVQGRCQRSRRGSWAVPLSNLMVVSDAVNKLYCLVRTTF